MPRILLALLVTAVLAAPVAAPAVEPEDRIAPGVTVAGVDVGERTVAEATAILEAQLRPRLERRLAVHVAGRIYHLEAADAGVVFDPALSARRAYRAGLAAAVGSEVDVRPAVTHDKRAVRALAAEIDRKVRIRARDARLTITVRRMIPRAHREGRELDEKALVKRMDAALLSPTEPRKLLARRAKVKPKVTKYGLRRVYPTVVTIDRASTTLRVFKQLKHRHTYRVAVGAAGYETPTGLYRIQNKAVNPVWTAPNKPWAGLYAGRSVAGGSPENPLKARWLGIANGVGIHGTAAEYSIGTRASHGCIRMRVRDVIDLYPKVPVGSPVLIR